ncbi:hypothetical protein ACFLU8_01385 [Chloroflexota bacterium]
MLIAKTKGNIMLLDDFLPTYDFTEVHSIPIKASPEVVFRAIKELTLAEISSIVRLLFFIRSLPEKAVGRNGLAMNIREPLLSNMLKIGFLTLAEQPPHEFVFGIIVPGNIGRFWHKASSLDISLTDIHGFLAFNHPDYVCVVVNFLVEDADEAGFITVRTESRSRALSSKARKNFTPYWRIIRPFGGLIRRLWLQGIKNRSEHC